MRIRSLISKFGPLLVPNCESDRALVTHFSAACESPVASRAGARFPVAEVGLTSSRHAAGRGSREAETSGLGHARIAAAVMRCGKPG